MDRRNEARTATATAARGLQLTRGGIIATVLVVVVAATCIRLGFWQLDRLEQRRARNAAVSTRGAAPPIPVARAAAMDTSALTWRRIVAVGEYDNARTIILAGRAHDGRPGVFVLTPMRVAGAPAVLVDRGFVPTPDAATIDLAALKLGTRDSVLGLARTYDPPGGRHGGAVVGGRGAGGGVRVYRLEPGALRELFPYRLASFWVQALPDTSAPAVPQRTGPPELDEGPHMGYAIQWFGFAAVAIIGGLALALRRR